LFKKSANEVFDDMILLCSNTMSPWILVVFVAASPVVGGIFALCLLATKAAASFAPSKVSSTADVERAH
jgi:hypothetical protein